MYQEWIQITRQFAFCPMAFRIDTYKGCSFGCQYCSANMDWMQGKQCSTYDTADMDRIRRFFYRALETDKSSKSIIVEMIRHGVPVHCGGMSDPFQHREWELGLTKQLIEMSNYYHYPILFSTKTAYIPQDYLEILNKDIHAFQVSLMGWNQNYVNQWETNTPSPQQRLEFIQMMRQDYDFWVSVRIQPIIDIDEVLVLCEQLKSGMGEYKPNYVTVEHFKSTYDVVGSTKAFLDKVPSQHRGDFISTDGRIRVKQDVKLRNIGRIKEKLKDSGILIGVGDNDLHYLSDTRCCCGTDTIPSGCFDKYMRYNLTYMCTGEFRDEWIPKCNPRKHINDQKYGLQIDPKEYVEDYVRAHPDYLGDRRVAVQKQLFGKAQGKLI